MFATANLRVMIEMPFVKAEYSAYRLLGPRM